jgi:uncharacterized protein with GYD domain
MPTYVALLSWTQQGVASFKDTVDRYEQAKEAMGGLGVSFTEIYWTLGAYDIVSVVEAPDDETLTAAVLSLGAQGNVRTTTMRAFSADEMRAIIQKAG